MEKTTESLDKQNLLMLLKRYSVQHNSMYHLVPTRFLMETFHTLEEDCEGVKIGICPSGFYSHEYYCGNCGETIQFKNKFCHECGKLLKWPECEPKRNPEKGENDGTAD